MAERLHRPAASVGIGRRLVLATGLLLVCASALADAISSDDKRAFADGLYVRGMYELAEREYASLLDVEPEIADAPLLWYRLAECRRELGRSAAAEQCYARAATSAKDDPLRDKASYKRALMLRAQGHLDAAIELLETLASRQLDKEIRGAVLFSLGDCYDLAGKESKAIDWLAKLISEFPDNESGQYARLRLARLYADRNVGQDTEQAIRMLNSVVAAQPVPRLQAEAHYLLGHVFYKMAKYRESAREFMTLQRSFPEDERTRTSQREAAWAFFRAGLFADAAQSASAAIEQGAEPRDEWLYLRANSRRSVLELSGSAADYREILRTAPQGEYADASRMELALVEYRRGNYAEAVAVGEVAQVTGKTREDLLWILAESHAALKQDARAIQYYRLLVEEFPDGERSVDARYRLAHALQKREAWGEAARQYEMLAERSPKHELAARSLYAAGICLQKGERLEEATRDWQKVLDLYPEYPRISDVCYQLAMAFIQLKRGHAALSLLDRLLAEDPDYSGIAEVHYWRASVLLDRKELKTAAEALRHARGLAKDPALQREVAFMLGVVLRQQGKDAEAADVLSTLMADQGAEMFSPERLRWLAGFELERGNFAACESAAQRLVELHAEPTAQEAGWLLVGRGRAGQKSIDGAITAFRKAAEMDLNTRFSAESALLLGDLLLQKGSYEEAKQWLETASERSSGAGREGVRVDAYMALGRLHEKVDQKDVALRYYMTVGLLFDDPARVPKAMSRSIDLLGELKRLEEQKRVREELNQRYPDYLSPEVE